ncbi:MAG: hypothetical protein HYV28_13255 [Ignavibacteriales bacterium]|nr:hypothetical protein [Ignavibacteriales bacterium]
MVADILAEALEDIKDSLANEVTPDELNQQDKELLKALQVMMYTVQSHFEAAPNTQKIMTAEDFATESNAITTFHKYLVEKVNRNFQREEGISYLTPKLSIDEMLKQ